MTDKDLIRVFLYTFEQDAFAKGGSVKPITGRFPEHIWRFAQVDGVKNGEIRELPQKMRRGKFYHNGQNKHHYTGGKIII